MAKRKKKIKAIIVNSRGEAILDATPERLQQYGDDLDAFKTDTGRTATRLSAVDWLLTHGKINEDEYRAAYKLLETWNISGAAPRTTANLDRPMVDGGKGGDAFSVKKMLAGQSYANAMGALSPASKHVVWAMVLGDLSPAQYAKLYLPHWKYAQEASVATKQMLIVALRELSEHYAPSPRPVRQGIRSSMLKGSKPVIAA